MDVRKGPMLANERAFPYLVVTGLVNIIGPCVEHFISIGMLRALEIHILIPSDIFQFNIH